MGLTLVTERASTQFPWCLQALVHFQMKPLGQPHRVSLQGRWKQRRGGQVRKSAPVTLGGRPVSSHMLAHACVHSRRPVSVSCFLSSLALESP